ncbi:MAG: hypothetical protein PHS06_00605 [Candidatus Shapirobacteria bacterium]|nr:hypothetical protein [Candidatus Shapirobacteria bacterium]
MEREVNRVLNPKNLNEVFVKRELFSVVKEKEKSLENSKNREEFLFHFGGLLFTVDEIIKSEQITDQELVEIEEVNMIKNIGFDGKIFLHWATDDDGPNKGERVSLETLITDGFFRRIKNNGAKFSFKKLDDVNFEKELLKKVEENGDNLMMVRTRKQFLLEFGDLLFLIDEVIKFKEITDTEIDQMETVKNKQK